MEELGKIFGSQARVKIMRLFIFNPNEILSSDEIAKRSRVQKQTATKEIRILESVDFIKKKSVIKNIEKKSRKKSGEVTIVKKNITGWVLNPKSLLVAPLQSLLVGSELLHTKDLPKRFKPVGTLRLLVLSGIFVKDGERKVDMLVVGDKLDRSKLAKLIQTIESEIGKELRYAVFDPEEFTYRLHMYDRLLLDIFENEHQRIIEKLKVPL